MLTEIPGGCVRYDKIAFVPLPVGFSGFVGFLRFQPLPHISCFGIRKHLLLQVLLLPQSGFCGFQLGGAALQVRIGRYKGFVQSLRGIAVLLHSGNGSRHLFEVVDCRPAVIAHAFPLGAFRRTVYHALNTVISRCGFGCVSPL